MMKKEIKHMYTRAEKSREKDKARKELTSKSNKKITVVKSTPSSVPKGKCGENNTA
jgi:molecular chaperone DnaK (HSP70)